MGWIPDRYRELRSLLRPDRLQDDVDEELAFHIEQRVTDLQAEGLSAAVAREQALRRFGDVTRIRAETYAIDESTLKEQRRMELLDAIRRETRHSLRSLGRAPVFTIVALLTLGVGVGATTAIFTLIDSIVLRPLPYAHADRLVALWHGVPLVSEGGRWGNSSASYFHYLDNNRTLDELGAYSSGTYSLSGDGGAERVPGASVTPSALRALSITPQHGRTFTDNDYEGPDVVIIGHELWQNRFGGDPGIIGSTIQVSSASSEVIGIMPPGARLPGMETQIWTPMWLDRSQPPVNSHWIGTIGLLRAGVTPEVAQADVQRLTDQLVELFPGAYDDAFVNSTGFHAQVTTVRSELLGGIERTLWLLLGAVSLVLLIACANVANLFMVRAEARRREQTVRAAMGAERAHFAVHYLTESMLLAVAAGLVGVFFAWAGVKLLLAVAPVGLPRLDEIALTGTGVAFALGVAALMGMIFGLAPAVRTHADFHELREAGRGMTASRGRLLVRNSLVIGQVGLALVLLAAGALMLQSFMNLRAVDAGFDESNILAVQAFLPAARYPTVEETTARQREIADRIAALPGVANVSLSSRIPLSGGRGCAYTTWENMELPPGTDPPCLPTIFIFPGYFETLGIRVDGEVFTWSDVDRNANGVVVSRALAASLWPGEDPLGKGIISYRDGPPWYRVIGVADDVLSDDLEAAPIHAIYYPPLPMEGVRPVGPFRSSSFLVKTSTPNPAALAPSVRSIIAELDAEVAMGDVRTMREIVLSSDAIVRRSFMMALLSVAAGIALFLSAVGLYGVIAYLVGRRRTEIGVRMALGARVGEVARMVVLQSVRLTAIGIAVGVAGAIVLTRSLQSLLYGVQPADPLTLGAVSALLLLVAVLASVLPASRAARTDPSTALRSD
jgi:putative ABC transport system permease protein